MALLYVKMRPFTDAEWDELPHVVLTSDVPWDPSFFDEDLTNDDEWYNVQSGDVMENPLPLEVSANWHEVNSHLISDELQHQQMQQKQ